MKYGSLALKYESIGESVSLLFEVVLINRDREGRTHCIATDQLKENFPKAQEIKLSYKNLNFLKARSNL